MDGLIVDWCERKGGERVFQRECLFLCVRVRARGLGEVTAVISGLQTDT